MKIIQVTARLSFLFVLLSIISCSSSKTIGVEQGWELLDDRKVNFVRDKDVIDVNSRSSFTAIQFKVEEKDVRISELKIQFENGDKLEPSIDEVIKAGESSRLIELGREGRGIDKIEFKYRSMGNVLEGRARVVVLGRRYDPYYNR